ncbi:MAG: SDR family oxidoreductase [Chloroflexota bacterium]
MVGSVKVALPHPQVKQAISWLRTVDIHMKSIALVSGANRGIGFEVCRQLGQAGFQVILTSRNRTLGEEAAGTLAKEGLQIIYHQLDVTKLDEIEETSKFVSQQFDRLDILINNAGVNLDGEKDINEIDAALIEDTLKVNFYGPLHLTRTFLPLMQKHNYGRIVNVSSSGGSLSTMATMAGKIPAYRISKAALNAQTRLIASAVKDYNIKVNAMCPGRVKTRMGGEDARRSPRESIDTILWLATLPASGPTGGFYKDRKKLPW